MFQDYYATNCGNKGPEKITVTPPTTSNTPTEKKAAQTPDISNWDVIDIYGNDTII